MCWNTYFYSVFKQWLFLKKTNLAKHWLWKPPNLAKILTPQHAYIYIYIHAVEVKMWSKICLFLSQNVVQVFSFFCFVFQKSSSFCRENEIFKKNEQKKEKKKHHFLSQNVVQLCCATYLDHILTQPWTTFWLKFLGIFTCLKRCWNHYFYSVFSKKRKF